MSAPLYIPSSTTTAKMDPPASISVKTASYTIPTGRYAVIRNLHGDLTINGVEHYTILSSFNRVQSATGQANDYIFPDSRCDFIKTTRTSTVSNGSNQTKCDFTMLSYYLPGNYQYYLWSMANQNFGGLFYTDASFTTTRTSYLNPLNYQNQIPYFSSGTPTITTANQDISTFGLSFMTYRASGTVTHTGFSASFSKDDFLVPSGTVLDGVKYTVTEYIV